MVAFTRTNDIDNMDTKSNIVSIVTFYKLAKAEGMNSHHVTRLLAIANGIEITYEDLKQEVNSLKGQKRDLNNVVTKLSSELLKSHGMVLNFTPK